MPTSKPWLSSSGRPWTQTLQSGVQVRKRSHSLLGWAFCCCFYSPVLFWFCHVFSWKVSRVCGGKPKLPLIAAHVAGEVPGQRDSRLRCCHIQELHQKKLANCEFHHVTRVQRNQLMDNGYWWNKKRLDCYLHCLYPAFERFLKGWRWTK